MTIIPEGVTTLHVKVTPEIIEEARQLFLADNTQLRSTNCPVARAIKQAWLDAGGSDTDVATTGTDGYIGYIDIPRMPDGVSPFVLKFDHAMDYELRPSDYPLAISNGKPEYPDPIEFDLDLNLAPHPLLEAGTV